MSFLLALLLTIPFAVSAESWGPYDNVEVVRVKDGDTVAVKMAIYPEVVISTSIRLFGVDTPETRRGFKSKARIPECELELGKQAAEFTKRFLSLGNVSVPFIYPKKTKYAGRMLGDITVNGASLAQALIDAGLGVPYYGGKRAIWPC